MHAIRRLAILILLLASLSVGVAQKDDFNQQQFPPRPAPRIQTEKVDEDDPPKGAGTNLPNGVFIDYWLKEKPKKDQIVKIEV